MIDRIKKLMEKRGLSPSQFADEIGLKRSSLSHILSGRNNPSLDVIMKIKGRYDEVNTDWLLLGVGTEISKKSERIEIREPVIEESKKAAIQQQLSFEATNPVIPAKPGIQKDADKPNVSTSAIKETNKSGKPIRMVVFYSDQTFESFESR
ncbi:MAG: helix-turn-helix domain-containing protein [Bacteroidales bacterium]|nr:helix-turn-helix domain-containing protein [Bacteroidales bacterium]